MREIYATFFAIPTPFYILLVLGWATFWLGGKGRRILIFGVSLFLFFSLPIVPKVLGAILYQVPGPESSGFKADLILVPTAGIGADPFGRWAPNLNSMLRLKKGLETRKETGLPLLLIGGNPNPDAPAEAPAIIKNLNLEDSGILIAGTAKNSWETAQNASKIEVGGKTIRSVILVTSAEHVLRMAGVLRNAGLEVRAIPVFEPINLDDFGGLRNYFPGSGGMGLTAVVMHEFVGIAWYLLKGYIRWRNLISDPV